MVKRCVDLMSPFEQYMNILGMNICTLHPDSRYIKYLVCLLHFHVLGVHDGQVEGQGKHHAGTEAIDSDAGAVKAINHNRTLLPFDTTPTRSGL